MVACIEDWTGKGPIVCLSLSNPRHLYLQAFNQAIWIKTGSTRACKMSNQALSASHEPTQGVGFAHCAQSLGHGFNALLPGCTGATSRLPSI